MTSTSTITIHAVSRIIDTDERVYRAPDPNHLTWIPGAVAVRCDYRAGGWLWRGWGLTSCVHAIATAIASSEPVALCDAAAVLALLREHLAQELDLAAVQSTKRARTLGPCRGRGEHLRAAATASDAIEALLGA